MSTSVTKGWLKDKNNKRFAPNTFASQVITSDNQTVESKIKSEHDGLQAAIDKVDADLNSKILNYTDYEKILLASDWQGNSAPYEISISLTSVKEDSDVQVLPNYNMTIEEATVWMDAKILSGKSFNSSIKLKAYGDKPIMNLPITILVGSTIL